MKTKILITGATGATGGSAIVNLLAKDISVRALVHKNDERSDRLGGQGVEIVQGDLSDFDAVSEVTMINEHHRSRRDASDPSYGVLQGTK